MYVSLQTLCYSATAKFPLKQLVVLACSGLIPFVCLPNCHLSCNGTGMNGVLLYFRSFERLLYFLSFLVSSYLDSLPPCLSLSLSPTHTHIHRDVQNLKLELYTLLSRIIRLCFCKLRLLNA